MKLRLIQTFLLFTTSVMIAQLETGFGGGNSYAGATVYSLSSRINNETNNSDLVDLSTIEGSPYETDLFMLGKASNKLTKKSQPNYIRYNVYNDVIELKENLNDTKIIGLIKSLNIYAIVNNKEYHYEIYSDDNSKTNEGYFILISKGVNSNLYLKKSQEFKDKVKAKDAYHNDSPATFENSEAYYVKKGRILHPLTKSKKEFLKQFPEKESELKKYMKAEKINLKSEKDVVKLFKYYDSIL